MSVAHIFAFDDGSGVGRVLCGSLVAVVVIVIIVCVGCSTAIIHTRFSLCVMRKNQYKGVLMRFLIGFV